MSDLRVLVVGASIAGPTTAYWLAKAGATVTVIERFPEIRSNGHNIDIRTTGVTVMRKMPGMEAAVRAKTSELEGFGCVGDDGQVFATMTATGNPDQQSLVSEYEISRGDLAHILYDLTRDNGRIKYVFGEQVVSIQQKDNAPVMVEFANGFPSAEYDLVVACDGATSRTRAIGFGCGVRDHIIRLNAWAAFFSVDQDLLDGSKLGKAYSGVKGRWLAAGFDRGKTLISMMDVFPQDGSDATLPFREASKQGDAALKKYISVEYQEMGWKTNEFLTAMNKSTDFYGSEIVQVKVPNLYKGRFVLVGDAGHAAGFTGVATSLAMTGGYVLAGEIARNKGDLAAGLKGYEERMRPIINEMQPPPPGLGMFLAPQTALGIWVRNAFFRLVSSAMVFGGIFTWIGSFFTGWWSSAFGTDKYQLPEYF